MKFLHLCRRLHLYFGLSLLPWFFMYGLSSIPFSHPQYFDQRFKAKGVPQWTPRFEKSYEIDIPAEGPLRPVGTKIMRDHGLEGAYGAYRQGPNQINVYVHTFWKSTQVKYFIAEKRLVAEDRTFRFEHFLTGMHAKGGFEQDGFFQNLWSVIVDAVCVGMLLWMVTGLLMWWNLPSTRLWGAIALGGGIASFGIFLLRL
jgi:hypothetical protein